MKLPSFRRLFSTDFPKEYQKLVDQLSVSLNNGIEVLYGALTNNITLRDNIACTVKDVLVTVDSTGTPTKDTRFTLNDTNKVDGIIVIMATNQTNSNTYPSGAVFVSGVQSAGSYIINNVTGLQANQPYLVRIVAFENTTTTTTN